MKIHAKDIGILAAVFVTAAVLFLLVFLSQRMPKNPENTLGNSAGNLNNGGLFCEDDGVVYFANAYDSDTLYRMNPDETKVEKISNAQVNFINAGGDYLYYYQQDSAASNSFASLFKVNGIYRAKKNGKKPLCLKRIPSPGLVLWENTIFYQNNTRDKGTTLWRVDTDKRNDQELIDHLANPFSVKDGLIYFSGTESDHFLYTLHTETNAVTTVWEGNLYMPIAQGDFVYYMDMSSDYRLCRYSLSAGTVEILTEDRLDFFNVYGDMIYYQKSSPTEPALKRIRTDGSGEEVVYAGVYQGINITSSYVYFHAFNSKTPVYRTPVNGPVNVAPFTAAAQAASENVSS